MRRLVGLFVLAAAAFAVTASGGAAAGPAHSRPLGIVPHARTPHSRSTSAALAAPSFLTFDANYETLIDQYLADVAHDSGATSNVYSIATQYSDGSGNLQYQSSFGGSYVDHDPLPANGCNDGQAVCLTDQELQAEIQNVLTAKGWHGSPSALFALLTPNGVGGCLDGSSTLCTTTDPGFCAYHSAFTDSAGEVVFYANEPYNATISGCDPGSSPNSDDADATINTLSHEHNEAITDPFGDAWWRDSDGQENGDLCAGTFGTPLGGTGPSRWNQVINGHEYWLQQEWSNIGSACLQNAAQEGGVTNPSENLDYHGGPVMHTNTTYAIFWLPTAGNAVPPALSGSAAVNRTLTSSPGAWRGSPTGYAYQWQRCSAAARGCVNIAGATGSTYTSTAADNGRYVRSTVSATNVNGASPYAASAGEVIVSRPHVSKAPRVSGHAQVARRLSAGHGSWTGPPTSYRYQWLRCDGHGGSCRSIRHATHATYRVTRQDARHRLRVRVTALNAAGRKLATSRATARVPAAR